DALKEKAKREAEEAEAVGEELPPVSGVPEPPQDTDEAEGIEEGERELGE
nr:hypothetical protein [Candidatus Korarchaeota archaeon]NIU82529.1 hypothetical protein [Candidatus Thorarchaeota archaeon]NIW13021.1 hypothetical protein [Candidatus Thorarchaeota archaeon]NIW52159.1 hypothetical protein [Candidatus Korarchaeota archaeon]